MANDIPYFGDSVLKPYTITPAGEVIFTDGTNNDIRANQFQCLQYGYTYNPANGTCTAYKTTTDLSIGIARESNIIRGANNTIYNGVLNSDIQGISNIVRPQTRNIICTGDGHDIAELTTNTIVSGTKAEVSVTNSITLGGNSQTDVLGKRQLIKFIMGGFTSDATGTNLLINNTTDSYFMPPDDCMIVFSADILGVRTGGVGSGTIGDYFSRSMKGIVRKLSGLENIARDVTTTIDDEGEVGSWTTEAEWGAGGLEIEVIGATDVDIEWVANVELTIVKT